jgi:hypothetical protein
LELIIKTINKKGIAYEKLCPFLIFYKKYDIIYIENKKAEKEREIKIWIFVE